jgi:hypothetical protein
MSRLLDLFGQGIPSPNQCLMTSHTEKGGSNG